MTIDPTTLCSIAQAAKAVPFSEPAIRNRIVRGELRTIKIADHVYLEEASYAAPSATFISPARSSATK